ncbi:hypothetical protein HaLaN_32937, partial [Haematococcus lacustris]
HCEAAQPGQGHPGLRGGPGGRPGAHTGRVRHSWPGPSAGGHRGVGRGCQDRSAG